MRIRFGAKRTNHSAAGSEPFQAIVTRPEAVAVPKGLVRNNGTDALSTSSFYARKGEHLGETSETSDCGVAIGCLGNCHVTRRRHKFRARYSSLFVLAKSTSSKEVQDLRE